MSTTPNLNISHIATSQASKEVTANLAFDQLDEAICAQFTINCAGGANVTPTASTCLQSVYLKLTGALTANISLLLPPNAKFYIVSNQTTGAFTITVITTTTGSTGIVLFPGETRIVYSDATNVMLAQSPLGGFPSYYANLNAAITLLALKGHHVYTCDATTAAFSVTLPSPAAGMKISLTKKDSSVNAVTIVGTINGVANATLTAQWKYINLFSDGVAWYNIGSN